MTLSIVIPVYNEEKTILEILKRVERAKIPGKMKKEIVIVDDASSDSSVIKIKKAKARFKNIKLVEQKVNKGKGAAVRLGITKSKGEIVIIQDADLEYDPNDYKKLLEPIILKKSMVVYGSRLKHYPVKIFGKRKTPFLAHYLGNKFLTFVTNILYGNEVTDMETCYKVISKDVFKSFKLESNRFEFEPEITAKILKAGYRIYEVPIKVNPRGYDDGKKITWKDGFIAIWTLLKYKFID